MELKVGDIARVADYSYINPEFRNKLVTIIDINLVQSIIYYLIKNDKDHEATASRDSLILVDLSIFNNLGD